MDKTMASDHPMYLGTGQKWCTQKCDDLRQEWAKICDYLGLNFRPIPSHAGTFMYYVQMDIATTRKNSAVNQQTCGS